MLIDVRSLVLAVAVLCLFQMIGMMVLWAVNRRLPGMRHWTLSTIFYAVSTSLFVMQGRMEDRFLSFVAPNVLASVAAVLFYTGACRFTETPVWRKLLWVANGVTLPVFLYFLYGYESLQARVLLMSMYVGCFHWMTAVVLWRERRSGLRFSCRFTAVAFGVYALAFVYRATVWLRAPVETDNFWNALPNIIMTLFALGMGYFWAFCVILMINQYQEKEISERMRKQFETEEELLKARHEVEKQRSLRLRQVMVRDLHDGIGGITATLAMLASVGRDEMGKERKELLRHIERIAIEGNREVRALMSSLDNGVFHWDDWLEDLQDYSRKTAEATGIRLEWKVEGEVPHGLMADTAAAISLMRAVKEAVHNVARHAGATRVEMSVRFGEALLEIGVKDNGKGFAQAREGGRGLKNMERRAEELGGEATVRPEDGTLVAFRIPLPLKYAEGGPAGGDGEAETARRAGEEKSGG